MANHAEDTRNLVSSLSTKLTLKKTEYGKVIGIFWTIYDPPGLPWLGIISVV